MNSSPKLLYQQNQTALGSTAIFSLVSHIDPALTMAKLWQSTLQFETQFSRFNPQSELSRLNSNPQTAFQASPELTAILKQAIWWWQNTQGIFNPAILPALTQAGYHQSFDQIDCPSPDVSPTHPNFDLSKIQLQGNTITLPIGMKLDLGGIGKGYLLDQLSRVIKPSANYWLALGGDLLLAGLDQMGQSWKVGLQNPYSPNQDIATYEHTATTPVALATSATFKRKGVSHNQPWHHLIDPRTGKSAQTDLRAVSVIGPQATDADVLASCCVILGSQAAADLMQKFPQYSAYGFLESGHAVSLGSTLYPIQYL